MLHFEFIFSIKNSNGYVRMFVYTNIRTLIWNTKVMDPSQKSSEPALSESKG